MGPMKTLMVSLWDPSDDADDDEDVDDVDDDEEGEEGEEEEEEEEKELRGEGEEEKKKRRRRRRRFFKRCIFDALLFNPACAKVPVHKSASSRSFFSSLEPGQLVV